MRKNILFYITSLCILIVVLFFFNRANNELKTYNEFIKRHNTVHGIFQNLSIQINNAAILTPDLLKADNAIQQGKLFFTDSAIIIKQLQLLKLTVRDTLNIRIANELDTLVKSEITWLLKSNVPDSIIHNKAPAHIASLQKTDSLISLGIQRTSFLIDYGKTQFNREVNRIKTFFVLFILLSNILLIYTSVNLFKQKSKTVFKEKELEKSEQLFKHTLDNMIEGIQIHDFKWRYKYVNNSLLKYSKYSREELLGYTVMEKYPGIEKTDLFKVMQRCMNDRVVEHLETEFVFPDGSKTDFELSIQPTPDGIFILSVDITERKKASLHMALFESIINFSDDAIISKTLDGNITSWNHGAEKTFGYSSEEIIGKHISILIPPHLQNEENELIEKIRSGEIVDHYETERIKKDGTSIYVSLTISPLKDAIGNIVGASKISRDITERKGVEEKIKESEVRYRSLIENSSEGIVLSDAFLNNIYRSPGAEKITGIIPNENAINLAHPDDLQLIKNKRVEVINNPGVPIPFQARFRHTLGHYIWMEGTFTNLLQVKGVNAIVTNYRDITERKKAEGKLLASEIRYRRLFEAANDGILILSFDTCEIEDVNPFLIEMLGYSHAALLGRQLWEIGLFKDINENKVAFIKLKNEKYIRYDDLPLKAKDGRIIWVEFVSNVYDVNERQVIQCNIRDISERRKAADQIQALNEHLESKVIERTAQLEIANKELESFSYSVSHDLRAPLRAINGYAKMLEEDYNKLFDGEGKRLLSIVQGNATKMGLLIDDLLTFSRLGKKEVNKTLLDMTAMATDTINELKKGLDLKAKIIINDLDPVMADNALMSQVWINLLSNAIKYSSDKTNSVIEINSKKENNEVVYSVSDNGAGFDMQYVHKLFGVFQRLHSEEEFEGTGVGLALVQRIINKHGGKIWAQGEVGKGATFYFSLPV